MSKINHGKKGFRVEFDNGLTLSVQYGKCNYCERQDYLTIHEPNPYEIKSKDFEMAVLKDGNMLQLSEHDTVAGWIPFEELPQIMQYVKEGRIESLREHIYEVQTR